MSRDSHDTEHVHWHNEIKPHKSLSWENLENPVLAFHRKPAEDRRSQIKIVQDAK
jgi:hypothetical protein